MLRSSQRDGSRRSGMSDHGTQVLWNQQGRSFREVQVYRSWDMKRSPPRASHCCRQAAGSLTRMSFRSPRRSSRGRWLLALSLRKESSSARLLVRRDSATAVAALASAADSAGRHGPGVDDEEVPASAGRTFQAKLFYVLLLHASPLRCFCRSESFTRVLRGAALPPETGENHKGVASRLETDVWSVNSAVFLTRTTMKLLSKHWRKR